MTQTFHHITRPALLAVLVASACSAMAAQRVDLTTVKLNTASQVPQTVYNLTGLSMDELRLVLSENINGQNISRFQQYYQGIPVLGEAIVIKTAGNPSASAPTSMDGAMLVNLSRDLPGIKPTVSAKTALELAKTLSRTQNSSDEKANLYIRQGANGAAHLVHIVSFMNGSASKPSQPVYMIDAYSGAVLDTWEGLETNKAYGAGDSHKAAFDTLVRTPGWNVPKAFQVIGYAKDMYWTANSNLNQGACGAEKAAADLGFNVKDVSRAFNLAGKCRSTAVIGTIDTTPDEFNLAANSTAVIGEIHHLNAPKAATNSLTAGLTTSTKYFNTAWKAVGGNVTHLGTHGTWNTDINRFHDLIGSGTTYPTSVCFNDFLIGNWNNCLKIAGWNNLQMHYIGTGTITDGAAVVAWRAVAGYNPQVFTNYATTAKTLGGQLLYSQTTTKGTEWSATASASITVSETAQVPLVLSESVSVTLGVSGTTGGSSSITRTQNFYAPTISVPAGKSVRFTLVERWQPVTTAWSVPVEFSGWVGGDFGNGWNGHHAWALDSVGYFYEYGNRAGAQKATINILEKRYHDMSVIATIL